MLSLGAKLRKYRKSIGMTTTQVGELAGLPSALISQYETGARNPKNDNLTKICAALGVKPSYFLDEPAPESNAVMMPADDIMMVPVFDFAVRAGEFTNHATDDVREVFPVSRAACPYRDARAVRVKGNSMIERGIADGDFVVVTALKKVKSGEIAIVCVDDETIALREVNMLDDDEKHIVLRSANSDKKKYPDRVVHVTRVRSMLRVVHISRTV